MITANDCYLDLIDWDDPADPIRQLIIPREDEFASATTTRMGSIIGVRGRIDFLIAVKIDSATR
jgi:L-lysine 2,3-aminomutase